MPAEQKAKLQHSLQEMFGTPAEPIVHSDDDETKLLVDRLQLQPETLAAGSHLYKKHCLQCHGLAGDGRGPTGQWVYPFPRDFRQGIYNYVSSAGSAARKPTRADLHRVTAAGIERTSMPAFAMLSEEERERLVSYTIHLGVRGEVEFLLMRALLSHNDDVDDDLAAEMRGELKTVLRQWVQARQRDNRALHRCRRRTTQTCASPKITWNRFAVVRNCSRIRRSAAFPATSITDGRHAIFTMPGELPCARPT